MVFTTLISIVSVSSSQLFTTYGNHWIAVDALHLCGILSHYSDKSSCSSIIFFAMFSRLYICSISQTCSTWVMTGDNSYQECHSTWKNSCPCLAVSRWSINVLLAFNQATSNGIWGIMIFFSFFLKNEDKDFALIFWYGVLCNSGLEHNNRLISLPLYSREIKTRKCRIILLCFCTFLFRVF